LLHWAAICSEVDTLKVIVTHGANVNFLDRDGVTALHEAVNKKEEANAEVLVKAGAAINIKATKG